MKLIQVAYEAKISLPQYQNETIALVATLEEGETPEQVIPLLRDKVTQLAHPEAVAWRKLNPPPEPDAPEDIKF